MKNPRRITAFVMFLLVNSVNSVTVADTTLRQGLGESPGIPSLEYLGLGYNAITGNPRGTESSNIDPGFRASVIKLVNDQNVLTVDTDYTVPLGTEMRYITSCEYSSKASEISSSSSYQRELRRSVESTFSKTTNERNTRDESGSSSGEGSFLGFGGSSSSSFKTSESSEFSQDVFFSGSESYREFVKQTQETEVTSFESQGVCTEFEAALKKYYKHELHDSFLRGLASLPVPYNKDEEAHLIVYSKFLSIYGTHYISRISLGARTVFTSAMSRSSVKDLQNQDIDVASSYNFRVAQSMSASSEKTKSSSGGGSFLGIGASGSSSNTVSVSNYHDSEVTLTGSESIGINLETARKVSERIETTKEFNVGGLPAVGGDWKEWARSVKENPMPISYDITPLWSLIDDECTSKSLFDAIVDIYNLNTIGIANAPDIGSGIARANSEPAVSYSETDIFGRYIYATGPITRSSSWHLGYSLITYNVTLQDTFKESTSPLFATMISGGIGPEGDEIDLNSVPFLQKDKLVGDPQISDVETKLSLSDLSFSSFSWRSKMVGEKLSLAVLSNFIPEGTNDTEVLQVTKLNSFSYFSYPSLVSSKEVVVGVVNPDGTPVRKKSYTPLGYTVQKLGYGVWKIVFTKEFEKPPTLIAQPTWISSPEDMPKSNAQVSLAVRECTTIECTIYLGSETVYDAEGGVQDAFDNNFVNQHLGLSFLALDGNLTVSSLVHGTVSSSTLDTLATETDDFYTPINSTTTNSTSKNTTNLSKWTAKEITTGFIKHNITIHQPSFWPLLSTSIMIESNQTYTFVEISFKEKFLETPTIIITPLYNSTSSPFKRLNNVVITNNYLEKKSFVSVEYVSTSKALIKVGIIDTIGLGKNITGAKLFESLPFYFMAVGPLAGEKLVPDDDVDDLICSDMPSMSPSVYGKGKSSKGKSSISRGFVSSPAPSPSSTSTASVPTTGGSMAPPTVTRKLNRYGSPKAATDTSSAYSSRRKISVVMIFNSFFIASSLTWFMMMM